MDRILWQKITNIFTIIGAVAVIFLAYFAYVIVKSESSEYASSGVYRLQESAARIIAPHGFVVKPASISQIPNNHDFSATPNEPLLLTDNNIPFMIMENSTNRRVVIKLDGRLTQISLGDKLYVPTANCTLWLYSIKSSIHSFQMKCT